MAYTEAQWNNFQLQLPPEDRISYLEYLRLTDPAEYNRIISIKPSIYSQGERIDAAGNYNAYNPEMQGMTSGSSTTPAITTPTLTPTFNPAKFRAAEAAADGKPPKQSISAREALAQRTAARKAEAAAEAARIEADYQAYLLEKKAAAEAAAKAAADAKAAQEAADKAAADAKAAQVAADKAAADAAAATAAEKAAADAKAAELAAEAAAAAELAAATAAAADAAAANADATEGLPNGTPAVIPDATGPQGPEFYNKLKGKAQSGTPLTAEENSFVGNFLKHRAGILGGLQFQGKQLTAEQLAEKNFLTNLGYIKAETPTVTSDYEDVGGILTYKGEAYTGAYNGQNYVNGRVVETPGDDIYETLNGVFQLNGKPYTGIYGDKEYKNGVEVEIGSGNYETIGGILTYKGEAYSGLYQGKNYVNGRVVETPGEDKYADVNGVFTKNNEPFTGEYGGKKYENGILVQGSSEDKYEELNGVFTKNGQPYSGTYLGKTYENGIVKEDLSEVDGFTTKDGLLYEKDKLYSGEWQGKNYKDGLLVDDTGEPERPANVNKFFVYNKTSKTWEKPLKPQDGATYTWDDATGWVQETPGADKPAGTPAAYIYDEKTKTWIKPPQTDPNSTWDDTKGWIAKVDSTSAGTKPGAAWILSPDGKTWIKPTQPNPTDTWDDEKGWVAAGAPGTGANGTYTQADIDKAVAAALAKAKADAEAAAKAATATNAANTKASERQSIIKTLQDRFSQYGLSSLAKTIEDLAVDGATEATITLALQGTDAYKTRFKANQDRLDKGLRVLQPAEYLNLEDGYRQVLRSYGLTAFDNDDSVQQFISNDVSASELSNRVVTAVQRVQNADPAVIKQLSEFYGITSDRLVAYVLDPQQQFQKIERQIAAGEIGVAAGRQGLTVGVGVAEQLAAQGISQAEAQKGYSTIADILPTAEKLSAIYGETTQKYGQSEAEQEVFNSLASAQRAREKLSALEVAQFGGSSGLARGGLTAQKSGNF
jgi:hypothetical protein